MLQTYAAELHIERAQTHDHNIIDTRKCYYDKIYIRRIRRIAFGLKVFAGYRNNRIPIIGITPTECALNMSSYTSHFVSCILSILSEIV